MRNFLSIIRGRKNSSMQVKKSESLALHTTLHVGGPAQYFYEASDISSLRDACMWAKEQEVPVTPLGGGSNMLVSDSGVDGLVIRLLNDDVVMSVAPNGLYVTCGAGKVLDTLVAELVEKNIWGLENFSGIPGSVGAVPIQNVGAYGLEAKDVVSSVVAYDIETDTFVIFNNHECNFAYRHSFFKTQQTKKYIIVWVAFFIPNNAHARIEYADLARHFENTPAPHNPSVVREAVLMIRSKKFPDWSTQGTAGSFFKNPIIANDLYQKLKQTYPDLPGYAVDAENIKISLGFILDKILGLKGFKKGNVGLCKEQALVLVAQAGATANEIELFANELQNKVDVATGIQIEWEVTKV